MAGKVAVKLKLNVFDLENHVFKHAPRGYDALEVDKFFDVIIQDYLMLEEEKLVSGKELEEAQKTIEKLKQENAALALENSKLKAKIPNMKNTNVNEDNILILKRIDALEKYLYKQGIDPKKIK